MSIKHLLICNTIIHIFVDKLINNNYHAIKIQIIQSNFNFLYLWTLTFSSIIDLLCFIFYTGVWVWLSLPGLLYCTFISSKEVFCSHCTALHCTSTVTEPPLAWLDGTFRVRQSVTVHGQFSSESVLSLRRGTSSHRRRVLVSSSTSSTFSWHPSHQVKVTMSSATPSNGEVAPRH
jgi:hypothetical protein